MCSRPIQTHKKKNNTFLSLHRFLLPLLLLVTQENLTNIISSLSSNTVFFLSFLYESLPLLFKPDFLFTPLASLFSVRLRQCWTATATATAEVTAGRIAMGKPPSISPSSVFCFDWLWDFEGDRIWFSYLEDPYLFKLMIWR